jgi:hypothetical protein
MLSIVNTLLFERDSNIGGKFKVPMINKEKEHRLNPRTNRMKNFKKTNYLYTDIEPKNRTFKNLPRYADNKPKVRFQDWFGIKAEKINPSNSISTWGWGEDGKCYGWSHRAVHGFSIGEVVKPDTCGNEGGKEYTIKTREQCEEAAKNFAKDVS